MSWSRLGSEVERDSSVDRDETDLKHGRHTLSAWISLREHIADRSG